MVENCKCPCCGSEMKLIFEESAALGKVVVMNNDNIFRCTNIACGYTCNENALKQLYGDKPPRVEV